MDVETLTGFSLAELLGTAPGEVPRESIYDTALREVVEGDLGVACRLLGVSSSIPPQVLIGVLPTADLLLRVGERRLLHVAYLHAGTSDLVASLLIYRGVTMLAHPEDTVSQQVIVLGDERVSGRDEFDVHGFSLDLGLVYLRDLDPAVLLADPGSAPLAVLARGDRAARAVAFAAALRVIAERAGGRAGELLAVATVLATIRLDRRTIEGIVQEAADALDGAVAWILRDLPWPDPPHPQQ